MGRPTWRWDEIDTVVEYLRQLRGVDRVSFIAWSLGGDRVGGYAARHPDKVEKLFLYAPTYDRLTRTDPPEVIPEPGVPMRVARTSAFPAWDAELGCEDQFRPAIRQVLSSTLLEFDPVGRTWGEAGLRRAPIANTRWGWNQEFAVQIGALTLIIRGDLDLSVPESGVRDLYQDLGTDQKVFVHVACASHFMVWENRHMTLLRASKEWLRHGRFAGRAQGSFFVDAEGQVHPE